MRLLVLSLLTCVLFSGQLFAQEKKDQKATSKSKVGAINVQYETVQPPAFKNTLDSLRLREALFQNVGYGFQKSDNITGSISSLKMTAVQTSTYSNLAQYLIGRVAGVTVTPDPSKPSGYSIVIRGKSSLMFQGQPLFVVDGMPVPADNALTILNPQDIASVSVIKDGTAAIYGSRGANGVILITTKH